MNRDELTDDQAWLKSMNHVSFLQSILDKKASKLFAGHDNWSVDWAGDELTSRRIARLEERRSVIYPDILRLAPYVPECQALVDRTARMYNEMTHLRARAVRRRDYRYRGIAADLCRHNGRIKLEKHAMWADKKRPDRPAWGRFCQIITQSGRRHGCEIDFFTPEKVKSETNQDVID